MNRIKRRSLLRSAAALAGTGLLVHKPTGALENHVHAGPPPGDSAQRRAASCSLMIETANRFLVALGPEQRAKATFRFEDDERMNWHFIPKERKGIPLREMTAHQKHLASALLSAGLSQTGYIKAVTIMSLEDVLKIIENDSGEHRNPEKYYFSVFGSPSETEPWGYRIEGHHFSQNYTVVNGKATDGPSFFGANPAEVRQGPRKGLRTLAAEDDLGMDLIRSLDLPQRIIAIVGKQFEVLMALTQEYARNLPGPLLKRREEQVRSAGKNIQQFHGPADAQCPAVLCPVRAGDHQ
jgi:hypothetical protein